jgi:mRNA interferase MazF
VKEVKQKDIWYADLNPTNGSEQSGIRPVLIVSGNLLNEHLHVVWVAPLTSKIKRYKGNPIIEPDDLSGLSETSEGLIFHLRPISKERLVRKTGVITDENMSLVKKTVNDMINL